jgi:hypothetical protein
VREMREIRGMREMREIREIKNNSFPIPIPKLNQLESVVVD